MIKGRYVALVEVDFSLDDHKEGIRPFEDIRNDFVNGYVTEELAKELKELFYDDKGLTTIKVTQQYADLYKVEEGDTE